MKIYMETNCCVRRNAEFTKIQRYFKANGFLISDDPADADYIVLSTCAFKEREESDSLSRVGFLRQFPGKFLVLGCLPDISPAKFGEFLGIAHIAPKEIEKIDSFFPNIKTRFNEVEDSNIIPDELNVSTAGQAFTKLLKQFELSSTFRLRTWRYLEKKARTLLGLQPQRYYLCVCKGCLGNCTYCAIKSSIGAVRSRPVDAVVRQFREGLEKGYGDFIVLGDDVGAYGKDIKLSLPGLLEALNQELGAFLEKNSLPKRSQAKIGFHIQEIQPRWLVIYKEPLLKILAAGTIKSILCPIESGNGRVLELMNRRYDAAEIADFFARARAIQPGLLLATHVMAGFPSETEAEYGDSLKLVAQIHFDQVTVFPYDAKEGTAASRLTPRVDDQVIRGRVRQAVKFLRHENVKVHLSCPQ